MKKDRGRADPIRRKCKTAGCPHFLRAHARSDAEYCPACQEKRGLQSKSLAAQRRVAKTQVNAGNAAKRYDDYRAQAVDLHGLATSRSIKDVRFVATPRGIIVTGNYVPWMPDPIELMRATEYDADDPKIIEAIEAISQTKSPDGSSFHRKQHEDGNADTIQSLKQSHERVMLLEFEAIGYRPNLDLVRDRLLTKWANDLEWLRLNDRTK